MKSSGKKKIFLIDAYALIYRAYFAFSRNPRITSRGFDTSAIYGFTNTLVDLLNRETPDYLGVVFDTPKKTHRHLEYKAYKANRPKTPEGIIKAIPYIKKILKAFNIPVLFLDGFEADDVIGTLAKRASQDGFDVYMMTPDKDFAQLVEESIFMYRPGRSGKPAEIWDIQRVCERFDIISVEQVIDYLAMVGDAVDNIPGIAGVGPKTASKLLSKYGTIERVYDNIAELKGSLKEKVLSGKSMAALSKKLATILLDVPIFVSFEDLKFSEPDWHLLEAIFYELEFKKIYERTVKIFKNKNIEFSKEFTSPSQSDQLSLFNIDDTQLDHVMNNGIRILEKREMRKIIETLLEDQRLTIFVLYKKDTPLGISMSSEKNQIYYIIPTNDFSFEIVLSELTLVFEQQSVLKICFDIKRLFKLFYSYKVSVKISPKSTFDIMIADYLLHPDTSRTFLTIVDKNLLDTINLDLFGLNSKKEISCYLIEAGRLLFEIQKNQSKLLENNGLKDLYFDVELPLSSVLFHMEENGICIDTKALNQYSITLKTKILNLQTVIYQLAGEHFNINSPKQLGEILFVKLNLTNKPKKTKSGQFSTNENELLKLKNTHPIINNILLFRTYQKLISTYIDALPLLLNKKDNKIHTNFNQTVTVTGRLSSSRPNLQNIPIRKESGKDVRRAFVASNDHILMSADYSQIELRLIAELSQEENMLQAFLNYEDIHKSTAAKVFGVLEQEVTSEMRSHAKIVNFGIIYGVSAFGLSEQTSLTRKESAELIQMYFITYPQLKKFIDQQINFAQKNGYVRTILGRKRYLRNINSRNSFVRGHDERNAINMPVQGSAADLIKMAMISIQNQFENNNFLSKMVLQVHDELVFDVHLSEKKLVEQIVKNTMENIYKTKVPLIVEIGFGNNWLEAH